MSTFSIILIALWCIAIGLDGANAAIQYTDGNIPGGIAWTACAVLGVVVIILRVVNPE